MGGFQGFEINISHKLILADKPRVHVRLCGFLFNHSAAKQQNKKKQKTAEVIDFLFLRHKKHFIHGSRHFDQLDPQRS